MLIISRKIEETIIIDGNIEVTVLGIEGSKVKLGIKAPKNVSIMREEIIEAVKEENKLAGAVGLAEIEIGDFGTTKNKRGGHDEGRSS